MKPVIYLCGGINGLSDDECTGWRSHSKARLKMWFKFLDPMRRDYRGREDESVREIITGDKKDIDNSDLILAYCNQPSWGTAMEIFYAHSIGKRVITVCNKDRISPWLMFHSIYVSSTLDSAIEWIKAWHNE